MLLIHVDLVAIAGLEIATEAVAFATKYFRNATKIVQAIANFRPIYRYRELSTLTISWIIKEIIEGMQSLAMFAATFVSKLLNFAVNRRHIAKMYRGRAFCAVRFSFFKCR